ncbi:MAG: hypothetical protein IT443_14010, partial [Phycisphaeraceae bacterium]|nr:hypothetical protein [Phycisphaeraceae bacterium]
MWTAGLVLLAVVGGGFDAPLSGEAKAQLDTASDHVRLLDEGAWYPLLKEAAEGTSEGKELGVRSWESGEETRGGEPPTPVGLMSLDVEAVLVRPGDFRGQMFLIEGKLVGQPRAVERLVRAGPWDGRLEQWGIEVGGKEGGSEGGEKQLVLVYVVQPAGKAREAVGVGQVVRMRARFYKVWQDVDRTGEVREYLTFVGRGEGDCRFSIADCRCAELAMGESLGDGGRVPSVRPLSGEGEGQTLYPPAEPGALKTLWALLGGLVMLTAGYWAVRRMWGGARRSEKTKRIHPHPALSLREGEGMAIPGAGEL